jgi:hypothetical protein
MNDESDYLKKTLDLIGSIEERIEKLTTAGGLQDDTSSGTAEV